jgi:hypothetical protein
VTVYDDSQFMASADYRILATNKGWPATFGPLGGLATSPLTFVSTGRYWAHPAATDLGQWDLPDNYRTLLHEFGHLALSVLDSYFYFNAGTNEPATCTSPAIKTNSTPDTNATLMDWNYNATEFAARGTPAVPGAWDAVNCIHTEQFRRNNESDWETIVKKYKYTGALPAQWTLKTPIDYQAVVAGPARIPVLEWSRVLVGQDAQSSVCEPAPAIRVNGPGGAPASNVGVTLYHGDRLINEGVTDGHGDITLLGAAAGDLAKYTLPHFLLGAHAIQNANSPWIATQTVSCPAGVQSSQAAIGVMAGPVTVITLVPAAFDLQITVAPAPDPLQVGLQVRSSTALSGELQVSWMQDGAPGIVTPTLNYDSIAQAYLGIIPLADGLPTEGELFVSAEDLQQNVVHASNRVSLAAATPSEDQTIPSSDGIAELLIPANSVEGSGQISIQNEPARGLPPGGLDLLTGPYSVRSSAGITRTGAVNLTLHVQEAGAGSSRVDASSAAVYSWDGLQWQPMASAVLRSGQDVSAQAQISGTTYAVFGRWLRQAYLPLAIRSGAVDNTQFP